MGSEMCIRDRGKVRFGGLFPSFPNVGFLVKLGFLAPEVAVCAFKAFGPADPKSQTPGLLGSKGWLVSAGGRPG